VEIQGAAREIGCRFYRPCEQTAVSSADVVSTPSDNRNIVELSADGKSVKHDRTLQSLFKRARRPGVEAGWPKLVASVPGSVVKCLWNDDGPTEEFAVPMGQKGETAAEFMVRLTARYRSTRIQSVSLATCSGRLDPTAVIKPGDVLRVETASGLGATLKLRLGSLAEQPEPRLVSWSGAVPKRICISTNVNVDPGGIPRRERGAGNGAA
jgi:hypothetical protein